MAERSLDVVIEPLATKLVYEPRPGETIPRVEINLANNDFTYGIAEHRATESFQEQCGNIICGAEVRINTIRPSTIGVRSANMKCIIGDCPLGQNGGGAGDREPRKPLTPLPELHDKQSLPVGMRG